MAGGSYQLDEPQCFAVSRWCDLLRDADPKTAVDQEEHASSLGTSQTLFRPVGLFDVEGYGWQVCQQIPLLIGMQVVSIVLIH